MGKKIVAITACPVGIAHTYMAATALETIAKEKGHTIRVEKQGSLGPEDVLTTQEIAEADLVIIAVNKGVDLDRFKGKLLYQTTADHAMKNKEDVLERAWLEAKFHDVRGEKLAGGAITLGKTDNKIMNHIMAGIGYMIPMIIAGGMMITLGSIFNIGKDESGNIISVAHDLETVKGYLLWHLQEAGKAGFMLMIPLFAGFVANSIAGMPAIAPAMIGAYIANDTKFLGTETVGGFFAAILVALVAGYFVKYLKGLKWPSYCKPILGIMILPFLGSVFTVLMVTYVIGQPVTYLMTSMHNGLNWILETKPNSKFLIGAILGGMIGFDYGGPINKTSWMFANAIFVDTMNQHGFEGANWYIGTVIGVTIHVAPIGIWLSTKMFPNYYDDNEKVAANAAATMGMVNISEGAIPFAVKHPLQTITSTVIGSAVAGGLSYSMGIKVYGGFGGPLNGILGYVEAPIPIVSWFIACGSGYLITALLLGAWRKFSKTKVL